HFPVAVEHIVHRLIDGHAFPVGQQVDGDVIDAAREFRVAHPDMPRLGGGHRHIDLAAHLLDVAGHVAHAHVAAQDRFVADDGAIDVAVFAHGLHQRLYFVLV